MINVRKSVFETNSSSSHSIAVANSDCYETKEYFQELADRMWTNDENEYKVSFIDETEDLEFGRYPFNILYTFSDKVRYAFAFYSYDPNCEMFSEIKRIIEKYTGRSKIAFPRELHWDRIDDNGNVPSTEFYGYVDHQSCRLLGGFLEKSGITMEEFLTNRKYMVIIDGDEYNFWRKMKESGIINTSVIGKEYSCFDEGIDEDFELAEFEEGDSQNEE